MSNGFRTTLFIVSFMLVLAGGFLVASDPEGAEQFFYGLVAVPQEDFKGGLTTERQDYPNGWSVIRRKDGSIAKIERQWARRSHGPFFTFTRLGHVKTSTFNRDGNLLTIRNVGLDAPKWVIPFVKYSYYYFGPPPYAVLLSHLEERVKNEKERIAELAREILSSPPARQLTSKKEEPAAANAMKEELISLLVSGAPDFSKSEFDVVVEPALGASKLLLVHTINRKAGGDRYLGLVTIDLQTNGYPFTLHGPFTMGEVLKSKAGKVVWPGQNIFVRFDTCFASDKCEPWTFAYTASLTAKAGGMPYVFIYGKSHEYFEPGMEINLPNEGLSAEGKVEARYIPNLEDPGSAIFLQEFRYGSYTKKKKFIEKEREFFTFRCKEFVCDYSKHTGSSTWQFDELWNKATFLSKR